MFSTIVVGTDGSQPAITAVRKAGEVALASPGSVVHVVVGYHPVTWSELERITKDLPDEFKHTLGSDFEGAELAQDAVAMLRLMGIEPDFHVVADTGAHALLDIVDKVGADLLVVGSRGLGAGSRMLRGSVSTKVAASAPCSVLVVHQTDD